MSQYREDWGSEASCEPVVQLIFQHSQLFLGNKKGLEMVKNKTKAIGEGEYYAEYDEDSGMWCVFHTDLRSGFAYASFSCQDEAEAEADRRQKNQDEHLQ